MEKVEWKEDAGEGGQGGSVGRAGDAWGGCRVGLMMG